MASTVVIAQALQQGAEMCSQCHTFQIRQRTERLTAYHASSVTETLHNGTSKWFQCYWPQSSQCLECSLMCSMFLVPHTLNDGICTSCQHVWISTGHLPAIYRPSTGHLPAIYRSSTGHLPAIYRPSTGHLPVIYWSSTGHLPAIYRPSTGHLPAIYRPSTRHLPAIYWLSTGHLPAICRVEMHV